MAVVESATRFEVLGDFRVIREIGRGGMGVVYLARQESLGRLVALKVLPGEFLADPTRLQRFRLEAEVISRLDHPSIAPVYAVGEHQGVHFIAMKYLDGTTLDRLIRLRKPEDPREADPDDDTLVLPSGRVPGAWKARRRSDRPKVDSTESEPGWIFKSLRMIERVARALQHAHDNGVIHRDVKPSNILVDGTGHPWLLDFGLVRDMSARTMTDSSSFLGTAWYMAPEQVRGERDRIDHRIDIYSLGVTLYELVTLSRPFAYSRPDTLFHAIVNEEPIPPRKRNARLPKDLETVILKAMAKEPEARYASTEAFAEDLRRVRSFEPIVARPVSAFGRARKWVLRNPGLAGAMMFAVLSFVGMIEYSVYRDLLDKRRATAALENADRAFDGGRLHDALEQYNVYLALGGDIEIVSPRLASLRNRLDVKDSGPQPDHPK